MLFVWIKYIWCPSESYVGFIYFTTSLNDSCHGAVLCMYISQSFLRPRPPSFFSFPFSFRFVPHSSSLIPPPSPSLSPARPQHPARGYGERCKLPSGCGHSLATIDFLAFKAIFKSNCTNILTVFIYTYI